MSTSMSNKFMNRIFRRVSGLAWDLSTGKVGVKTENGIYTFAATAEGAGQITVNPFDSFGMALPAFAMQTKKADVVPGDLLLGDSKIIGWVTEVTEGGAYKVQDHNGHSKTYTPPKVAIMGAEEPTVMVVRNLMSLTGGEAGATGFAGSLLPLLLMKKGDSEIEKMLPLLLMSGGLGGAAPAAGTTAPAANPLAQMLPLLMLSGGLGGKGGDSSIDKLLPLLAISGGLGGAGTNPMLMMALMGDTDLFGGFGSFDEDAPKLIPSRSAAPSLRRL